MIVQFLGNYDNICQIARKVSASSPSKSFTADELAAIIGLSSSKMLEILVDLYHRDWIVCLGTVCSESTNSQAKWSVREHWSLTVDRHYEVLAIEASRYRLLNNVNDPCLFHRSLFQIVDPTVPDFWSHSSEPEEFACNGPMHWQVPGYWERYHDEEVAIRDNFWKFVKERYPATFQERKPLR